MKRILAFVFLALLSSTALAAADPSASLGLSGRLMDKFIEVLQGFEGVIRPAAMQLFGTLMTIELAVWSYKQIINGIEDVGSFALKLSWNIFIFGFFGWLMMNSHQLMSAIIQTFFKLGQDATGLGPLDAVSMLSTGVNTALAIPKAADLGMFSFLDKPLVVLTAIIAEIMTLAAFFVTAAQLVMAQVEAMIVISAAPIILAFGALSFTRDIATKVLSHALGTGVKVMTIYILAGVMVKIGPEISAVLAENGAQFMSSPGQLLEIIGIAGLMVLLAFFIPTVAGAMLSGQASLSGGSAINSAMGVAAGGAAIGAFAIGGAQQAASAAGGAAMNAAASAGGIAQALKAGVGEAGDLGKSGAEAAGFATGRVVGQGLGMAASGIGSALSGLGESFSEKMSGSTGGKIAAAIENSRGGSMSGVPAPASAPAPDPSPASSGSSAGSGLIDTSGNVGQALADRAATSGGAGNASAASGGAAGSSSGSTPGASNAPTPAPGMNGGAAPAGGYGASASNLGSPVLPASSAGNGDASGASISGPSPNAGNADKPKSKIESFADVLGSTHDMLSRGKEHIIDDRAQVGAAIDTKASH